jgi:ATP-dependent Clp protease ATP-binding subunit ClpA
VASAEKRPRRKAKPFAKKPPKPKSPGGGDKGGGVRTVPKVPLVRA